MTDTTEYEEDSYHLLSDWLARHWGQYIEFPNGCWIALEDDDGLVQGTSPYGTDWATNYRTGWEEDVHRWLVFWDEPRDERGQLMVVDG